MEFETAQRASPSLHRVWGVNFEYGESNSNPLKRGDRNESVDGNVGGDSLRGIARSIRSRSVPRCFNYGKTEHVKRDCRTKARSPTRAASPNRSLWEK